MYSMTTAAQPGGKDGRRGRLSARKSLLPALALVARPSSCSSRTSLCRKLSLPCLHNSQALHNDRCKLNIREWLRAQILLSSDYTATSQCLREASHLQNRQGKLRPVHAQLLSSCEEAPNMLLPVQTQPELLEGLPQALASVQRLTARHIRWPLQDIFLY